VKCLLTGTDRELYTISAEDRNVGISPVAKAATGNGNIVRIPKTQKLVWNDALVNV